MGTLIIHVGLQTRHDDMTGNQKSKKQFIEEAEKRFLMKVSSSAIEATFTALRRCLHRPTKVPS